MKVLFLVDRWSNGGVPVVIEQMRDQLQKRGHTTHLITYYKSNYDLPEDALCFDARFSGDWRTLKKIRHWLNLNKPDLIHDHFGGVWSMSYLMSSYWASRSILHYHNEPFPLKDSPDHHPFWKRLMEKYLVKKFRLTLGVSQHTRKQVLLLGVQPNRAQVLYNAIDLERCKQKGKESVSTSLQIQAPIIFGMIARLVFEKGVDTFLETLALLKQRIPQFQAWIIGDGDPKYEVLLKALVRQKGLESQVTFWGRIENVHPFLHNIDVFFFASRQEPFGLTLLEAMAHNCVTVGVLPEHGGGPHEFLTPFNSVMVKDRNPEELAEVILRTVTNQPLMNRIKQEAQHTVQQFTTQKMGDRLLDFYQQIASTVNNKANR